MDLDLSGLRLYSFTVSKVKRQNWMKDLSLFLCEDDSFLFFLMFHIEEFLIMQNRRLNVKKMSFSI